MLESDRVVFHKSIENYAKDMMEFMLDRIYPHNYEDSMTIESGIRNGRKFIKSIVFNLEKKQFKNYEYSDYRINIKEKVIPLTKESVYTKKFKYEILNVNDEKDFIRFDYAIHPIFPHMHINADENTWGNHLTYPDKTNLNLEKLDAIKAMNIFQKFVANPEFHILNQEDNGIYVSIIEGED